MSENHPAEENPAYDNPNLLLHWEREFIRTCLRFHTDSMRRFFESEAAINIKDKSMERWEGRQEHLINKLKQFQDPNEPEDDEEEEEYYEKHLTEITPFKKENNDD